MSNDDTYSIEDVKKALTNAKIQIEQLCKYQLPCGICDKTNEPCRYLGGRE